MEVDGVLSGHHFLFPSLFLRHLLFVCVLLLPAFIHNQRTLTRSYTDLSKNELRRGKERVPLGLKNVERTEGVDGGEVSIYICNTKLNLDDLFGL